MKISSVHALIFGYLFANRFLKRLVLQDLDSIFRKQNKDS